MKKIALIGCTGSIGKQVIHVTQRYPERFRIVAMAANSNASLFAEQIAAVRPDFAALRQEEAARILPPASQGTRFAAGEEAFCEACAYAAADIVFIAVSGFAGLKASLLALGAGKDIALANKESLVVGGDIVLREAQRRGAKIIPVDSEHSAIWQCLHFDRAAKYRRIILTASGGALRDVPLEKLESMTAKEALAHPNWDMGAKITVDCATMLNKGFEVIEAMHLYGAALGQVDVLIHRESIVHSMVEFEDGALLAQMGVPSMELPIQLALTFPDRIACGLPPVDFAKLGALHFAEADKKRYPCFALALECAKKMGTYPCVLNAAGEIAVAAFLRGQIKYTQIADIIEGTLSAFTPCPTDSYAELEESDRAARADAAALLPH